jgi:hypothetical protein
LRVLFPRNISLVVVGNEDFPLLLRTMMSSRLASSAIDYRGASLPPPVDEGSSIGWISKHQHEAGIQRHRPNDFPSTRLFDKCGNHQLFVAIPEQDLADAAEFAKFLNDPPHRILYLAVRNDFHPIIFGANVADRNQSQNLTTTNLVQS